MTSRSRYAEAHVPARLGRRVAGRRHRADGDGLRSPPLRRHRRDDLTVSTLSATGVITATHRLGLTNVIDVDPKLAWNGTGYGVLWRVGNSVTASYHGLDASLADVTADVDLGTSIYTKGLVWDATSSTYLAVLIAGNQVPGPIASQALATSGALQGGPSTLRTGQTDAHMAAIPSGVAVSYAGTGEVGIMLRGSVSRDVTLASAGSAPVLVWTGAELGAAYYDATSGALVLARLDGSGDPVGDALQIQPLSSLQFEGLSVAYGNGRYAISWSGNDDIFFAQLCPL